MANARQLIESFSRLVANEVSHLGKAPTLNSVNISGGFTAVKFTDALQHLKPGKTRGLDSFTSR